MNKEDYFYHLIFAGNYLLQYIKELSLNKKPKPYLMSTFSVAHKRRSQIVNNRKLLVSPQFK